MHLLLLDYDTDAERKRIDYAIERWQDKIKISKPRGIIIIVDGKMERMNDFIEDFSARLDKSEEKVEVYKLEDYRTDIEKNVKNLTYQTTENIEFLKKFFSYLMTKLNASYDHNSKFGTVYDLYTKKGQVKIDIVVKQVTDATNIIVKLEGYGSVVDFISEKINTEVNVFLEGK